MRKMSTQTGFLATCSLLRLNFLVGGVNSLLNEDELGEGHYFTSMWASVSWG